MKRQYAFWLTIVVAICLLLAFFFYNAVDNNQHQPPCPPRNNEQEAEEWILTNLKCERHLTPYSSWIDFADYCPVDKLGFFVLSIKRGSEPHTLFERVPIEFWEAFKVADSPGHFFASEIRKPAYRFRPAGELPVDAPEITCRRGAASSGSASRENGFLEKRDQRTIPPSALDEASPGTRETKHDASASPAPNASPCTNAGEIKVKYRGRVNLAPFECLSITRSSFIECVCYDAANTYMLINLKGAWYHYCEIDKGTVSALLGAESMGRFYNAEIKGRFDCRTHRVPAY